MPACAGVGQGEGAVGFENIGHFTLDGKLAVDLAGEIEIFTAEFFGDRADVDLVRKKVDVPVKALGVIKFEVAR